MNSGDPRGDFVALLGLSLGKLLCYERAYRQEDCCSDDIHLSPPVPHGSSPTPTSMTMKTQSVRPLLLGIAAFCCHSLSPSVRADIIAKYDFTGEAGSQATSTVDAFLPGMIVSDLTRGSGVTASAAVDSISSNGWTTAGAIDVNDYYEFAMTVPGGNTLSISSISFAERRSGSGIRNWEMRSSLDG